MTATTLILGLIVLLGFSVEAALGFGATIVAVSAAAFLVPINEFLPSFLPLNLGLSAYLVARGAGLVDRRLLFGRVIPLMALGLPLGLLLSPRLDPVWVRRGFGVFVSALAVVELRRRDEAERGPTPVIDAAFLVLGGIVHGFFATGGPMAVYVMGRRLPDKGAFRATLSALWLVLNAVIVAAWVWDGSIGRTSLERSALWAPGMLLGIVAGEWAHARVPTALFRRALFVALALVGVVLVARR